MIVKSINAWINSIAPLFYFNKGCYGPSVISVTVTTGGHPRRDGLYGTSGTMGRGVAESRG